MIATDPAVREAGIDVGYAIDRSTLRAPDIAVGNLTPGASGWAQGAPPLAIEYDDGGAHEADLTRKISEFFKGGTKLVWVVRLRGPRRVEVHEPGRPTRIVNAGDTLTAPGILAENVRFDALYDREAALDDALRNLLRRAGYRDLDAVRDAGRAEGREAGLRIAVEALCEVLAIPLDDERRAWLADADEAALEAQLARLRQTRSW